MTEFVKYFVLVIVVWRLTHLLTSEDGPFEVIIKIRKLLGATILGDLMDCFYCASVWIGMVAGIYAGATIHEIVILTLYYSGASMIINKFCNAKIL